ncbi:MAG: hypothetical protein JNL18_02535 [Planctomycetaceae bacterium]|nr:hypothetical protein [Planctomycetaceae bacterium]
MNARLSGFALIVLGGALFTAGPAAAQHFDVFVGRPATGAQTSYGGIDVDAATITLEQRVFESEMGVDPFDGSYTSDEPGFNHPADDSALPAGAASLLPGDEIFVTALPLTVGGTTSSLFFWDGVGSSATFAPAVGVIFTIDTGNMTGSIGSAGANGGFDDHPFFLLDDGDGNAATSPTPGIYLASFQAVVDDLNPTDPLFLVMGTEGLITAEFLGITEAEFNLLSEEELDEALEGVIEIGVDFVQTNVIPEPGSLALASLACCGVGLAARRRRNAA